MILDRIQQYISFADQCYEHGDDHLAKRMEDHVYEEYKAYVPKEGDGDIKEKVKAFLQTTRVVLVGHKS